MFAHVSVELAGWGLKKMIGFRNIAIHDYKKIDTEILKSTLENNLIKFPKPMKAEK